MPSLEQPRCSTRGGAGQQSKKHLPLTLTVTLKKFFSVLACAARLASSSLFLPSSVAALSPFCTRARTHPHPALNTAAQQGSTGALIHSAALPNCRQLLSSKEAEL